MKNIKRNNENFRGSLFNCIERKSQSFYEVLCLIICFRFLNPQISSPQSRTLYTHTHILLHSYIITQYTYTDYKHIYFIMIIITFSKSLLNSFLFPFFCTNVFFSFAFYLLLTCISALYIFSNGLQSVLPFSFLSLLLLHILEAKLDMLSTHDVPYQNHENRYYCCNSFIVLCYFVSSHKHHNRI